MNYHNGELKHKAKMTFLEIGVRGHTCIWWEAGFTCKCHIKLFVLEMNITSFRFQAETGGAQFPFIKNIVTFYCIFFIETTSFAFRTN